MEHIERRLIASQRGIDESEAAMFGVCVGFPSVGQQFVAGFDAFVAAVFELFELRFA